MRRTKTKFMIALVNNADPGNPAHWDYEVSVRESRAIRKARKLRKEGNNNIMLFRERNGVRTPVSLKVPTLSVSPTGRLNVHREHVMQEMPKPRRKVLGKVIEGPVPDEMVDAYHALRATNEVARARKGGR